MARGWESKAVAGQQEAREAERHTAAHSSLTREQLERLRQKESLLLSRTRVLHDLQETRIPQRRNMLAAALAHLEARLKELERRPL